MKLEGIIFGRRNHYTPEYNGRPSDIVDMHDGLTRLVDGLPVNGARIESKYGGSVLTYETSKGQHVTSLIRPERGRLRVGVESAISEVKTQIRRLRKRINEATSIEDYMAY